MHSSMTLSLSGGGFRATLFHIGVLRAFYDAGLLSSDVDAPRVTRITSVSGGSILAAHMFLDWKRYSSPDPADFENATKDVIAFTGRDIRGRILRRLPVMVPLDILFFPLRLICTFRGLRRLGGGRSGWTFGPCVSTRLMMSYLERLYSYTAFYRDGQVPQRGRATLATLGTRKNGEPELYILGCNITTGNPCVFSGRGFADVVAGDGCHAELRFHGRDVISLT